MYLLHHQLSFALIFHIQYLLHKYTGPENVNIIIRLRINLITDTLQRYLKELFLQLLEFFGAGTAAVITPINRIGYLDINIDIPTTAQAQPVYQRLKDTLLAIQYGHIAEHPYVKVIS